MEKIGESVSTNENVLISLVLSANMEELSYFRSGSESTFSESGDEQVYVEVSVMDETGEWVTSFNIESVGTFLDESLVVEGTESELSANSPNCLGCMESISGELYTFEDGRGWIHPECYTDVCVGIEECLEVNREVILSHIV